MWTGFARLCIIDRLRVPAAFGLFAAGLAMVACGGAPTGQVASAAPATSSERRAPASPPRREGAALAGTAARDAVAAPDRSADDKAVDSGRHPAETLEFFGIAPGMRVAEIIAGFGYTTELLVRTVGPSGKVYAQNNRFIFDTYGVEDWIDRLAKPVNRNVVRVDRELEDPLPPDAKELDVILDVLFYHDTFWLKTDRARMNASIFAALKRGGIYGIVDHSGRDGTGATESKSLHRIEEKVVRDEITSAGFKLLAEGTFLRNPEDTRDWNASPIGAGERRGTSDRFVLKFVKP
ncbi:MAG TPA: SAM-dependent methyltransferase [Polyangiaceae bacterium]|nr:SAM-dependent methyltransferase [Polyangiaceae bacterium]